MSGIISPTTHDYTLAELAGLLGVEPPDAVAILEESGYTAPDGDECLTLTEEEYRELLASPPPTGDEDLD